jgi:hypothetical protein
MGSDGTKQEREGCLSISNLARAFAWSGVGPSHDQPLFQREDNFRGYTHRRYCLEIQPDILDDALHVLPLLKKSQLLGECNLSKDVEHEELDSLEEVQLNVLVSKLLIQASKEVSQGRSHEWLHREQVSDRE